MNSLEGDPVESIHPHFKPSYLSQGLSDFYTSSRLNSGLRLMTSSSSMTMTSSSSMTMTSSSSTSTPQKSKEFERGRGLPVNPASVIMPIAHTVSQTGHTHTHFNRQHMRQHACTKTDKHTHTSTRTNTPTYTGGRSEQKEHG